MKLRELAHGRTGDKGNTLNVSVICFDAKHYSWLRDVLTPERVKAHLADVVKGDVVRYELPLLGAFNFVLGHALGGGVTRSLALDAHGKSMSTALLDMDVSEPPESGRACPNARGHASKAHSLCPKSFGSL